MSDSELSDINGDDDLVRRYENKKDDSEDQHNSMDEDDIGNTLLNDEVKTENDDTKKKVEPPSAKPRVPRKMFVLNSERLKGKRGIHTIEKLYQEFKFKGKGHEKDDLNRVMKNLEYWAFRLFPKLQFDDVLSKCEHLGHKKDLQTHLKKYRLGMITADDNCTQDNIIEDENDDGNLDKRPVQTSLAEIANDNFQRLFDETELDTNNTS